MATISSAAADAMLSATVLVMLADGHDSDAEHEYVLGAWLGATGEELDHAVLTATIASCRRDPDAMWALLATQAAVLDPTERHAVFKGAVMCLLADAEMDIGEMMALRKMAATLNIAEYKKVMNEVWRTAKA